MSTAHLGEPVSCRDLLARADCRSEGALSRERKASQASSRVCGAAGSHRLTSCCGLSLDRFMGGRKTSVKGLRGCALRKIAAGSMPIRDILTRHIVEEGRPWTGPSLRA